ncbi:MAG: hypothetical protein ACRDKY_08370 [Solirubrobacteraceae bacterium]
MRRRSVELSHGEIARVGGLVARQRSGITGSRNLVTRLGGAQPCVGGQQALASRLFALGTPQTIA